MNDKKDPGFIPVKVTVVQNSDGSFSPVYSPEVIKVTVNDTVIDFKLDGKTAASIKVTKVDIAPSVNTQLSAPVISKSGRQVTLNDVNTEQTKFNLTFHFNDGSAKASTTIAAEPSVAVADYPEIDNVPPRGEECRSEVADYPEIDNVPPR